MARKAKKPTKSKGRVESGSKVKRGMKTVSVAKVAKKARKRG